MQFVEQNSSNYLKVENPTEWPKFIQNGLGGRFLWKMVFSLQPKAAENTSKDPGKI
jgi:hypothetical protein